MRIAASFVAGAVLLFGCANPPPAFVSADPPFSLPIPKGYAAGPPATDAAGMATVRMTRANAPAIVVSWRRAPTRDLLITYRQVKQLELRDARLVSHEEKNGRLLLRFAASPDRWMVRSAIVVGDFLVDCAIDGDGKPPAPDPTAACAGLSATTR